MNRIHIFSKKDSGKVNLRRKNYNKFNSILDVFLYFRSKKNYRLLPYRIFLDFGTNLTPSINELKLKSLKYYFQTKNKIIVR